jgi:hypothetical protein
MLWYYFLFSIIALIAYAKLFIFRKAKDIDLQETFIFIIMHSIMVFFMIKVFTTGSKSEIKKLNKQKSKLEKQLEKINR